MIVVDTVMFSTEDKENQLIGKYFLIKNFFYGKFFFKECFKKAEFH